MIIDIITVVLVLAGLFFFLGAVVGLIRFPDFYTRMHAAGKGDTLSTLLILSGLAVYNLHHFSLASVLVSLKILLICGFIFITSPTATHALMDAGYEAGIKPWTKKKHKPRGAPSKKGERTEE